MPSPAHYLNLAARLALRGQGLVEPNPMVGAVLVKNDHIIGLGHHTRFGHLHAEREALDSARRQGHDPRGSTIYVTLEPCAHHGKQPPCTDALIAAGIARVVAACRDPNPRAAGGADILRRAGIAVDFSNDSPLATAITLPFIKNTTTDLPYVIAKWAQSSDGLLVTPPGRSKWISNTLSRRRVHLLRARVDAVLTGIGTVLSDDPLLTARNVPIRRTARRIVLDANLRTPLGCRLVATAKQTPLTILTVESSSHSPHAEALRAAGAEILPVPRFAVPAQTVPETPTTSTLDLHACLHLLRERHSVHTMLLEAGPTLLSGMFESDLIDAAVVHRAPIFIGGDSAAVGDLAESTRWTLARQRRCAGDVESTYLRRSPGV